MQVFYYLVLVFYGFIGFENDHDIHVSVTDIEISDDGGVEIVVKVFIDDLMQSMGLEMGAELPDNYTSSDDLINQFLNNNLDIKINEKELTYTLDDTAPSTPAVWITLIGKTADDIKTIEINNKILIDQFDDQSNMINVTYLGERYSEMLNGGETQYVISVGK